MQVLFKDLAANIRLSVTLFSKLRNSKKNTVLFKDLAADIKLSVVLFSKLRSSKKYFSVANVFTIYYSLTATVPRTFQEPSK